MFKTIIEHDMFVLDYFDNTNDSVLLGIMARHDTLYSTFEILSAELSSKTDEVCKLLHGKLSSKHVELVITDNSLYRWLS